MDSEFEASELNAISRRNIEIVKTYWSMHGYKNMEAGFLINGMGFGGSLRGQLPPANQLVLKEITEERGPRKFRILDLFFYREDMSDFFFVKIVDEKALAWTYRDADIATMERLCKFFKVVGHLILQDVTGLKSDVAIEEFAKKLGIEVKNVRKDEYLAFSCDNLFDLSSQEH